MLKALEARAEMFAVLQKGVFCGFSLKLLVKINLCALKVRVKQRPWNESVAKTLFCVFFKLSFLEEGRSSTREQKNLHMLGWAH